MFKVIEYYDPASNHPAVNFLCQTVEDVDGNQIELRIPICQECENALQGDDWVLMYCIDCNHSQWVCKRLAKHDYPEKVMWVTFCPYCVETK